MPVSLLQGGYTRGQVLVGFSDSTEYQISTANEVFATMMYTGMLHRTPEPTGFNGWMSGLDSATYTRTQVINGFFVVDRVLPPIPSLKSPKWVRVEVANTSTLTRAESL